MNRADSRKKFERATHSFYLQKIFWCSKFKKVMDKDDERFLNNVSGLLTAFCDITELDCEVVFFSNVMAIWKKCIC